MTHKEKNTEHIADLTYPNNKRRNINVKKENPRHRQNSLAIRLNAGEPEAASELVDIYYRQIYLYMRRLGHNQQVSEDLTQESFLNAWRHINQLRDGKALNSWLYRIASNTSKLFWRKHKGTVDIEDIEVSDNNATYEKVGHNEELEFLRNAVERLPMKLRQTVVLHYMQQLTIAEAAEAEGIREGTFKSRLNRALKLLRKKATQRGSLP
jgi:RNA polymerase sigma-70 factor (ECF subfamily)